MPTDAPVTVGVLDNDQPPVGSTLSLAAVGEPTGGSAVANGDGTVTYTPDGGFSGQDTFTYTVAATNGTHATAQVIVIVKSADQVGTPEVGVIDPNQAVTLTFLGGAVALILPPGSYTGTLGTTDIFFITAAEIISSSTGVDTPPGTLRFAGMVFSFQASVSAELLEGYHFPQPITLILTYDPALLRDLPEAELRLYYWDSVNNVWATDGMTLVGIDEENNTITYQITHFTEFALFGSPNPTAIDPNAPPTGRVRVYLPAVQQ